MNKIIFLLSTLFILTSCQNNKKSRYTSPTESSIETSYTSSNHPGKKLMETKCYVCHNPNSGHDSRVAPPMVAIKSHYLDDETTKEQFANSIWGFVKQPSKENIKMKGAVRRFGIMPYQPFSEKDIKLISDYMYDFKIDEPEWFKEHIEEESKGKMQYRNDGKAQDTSASAKVKTPTEIGLIYALNTKKELGENLMGTIQKNGVLEAVKFCNKRAYPITDSMALAQNATIRRVTDKPRNPANKASSKELGIIAQFKEAISSGEDYQPITEIEDNQVHFYAPITTNSMCLQCHGNPNKDIKPEVLTTLTNLYPKDMAKGYTTNEVRGIWSITYAK